MIEGDVSACMIFSSIKKKKKITYHTGKQAVDIMSEMKTELGPDIKKKCLSPPFVSPLQALL